MPEAKLGDLPSERERSDALDREAAELEKRIPPGAVSVAFCVEGKMLSSEAFADQLENWAVSGKSNLCFLIGGSNGLSETIKRKAALCLSLSRMTFPHHLFRVMAVEQIYRAFTISSGMKYHK